LTLGGGVGRIAVFSRVEIAGQQVEIDGAATDGEIRQRRAESVLLLGVLHQEQAASRRVDAEYGDVAGRTIDAAGGVVAGRSRTDSCGSGRGIRSRARLVFIENVQKTAAGGQRHAERTGPGAEVIQLGGKRAVAADAEQGDSGVFPGDGPIGIGGRLPLVQHIDVTAAVEQKRADRIKATRTLWRMRRGLEDAGLVLFPVRAYLVVLRTSDDDVGL